MLVIRVQLSWSMHAVFWDLYWFHSSIIIVSIVYLTNVHAFVVRDARSGSINALNVRFLSSGCMNTAQTSFGQTNATIWLSTSIPSVSVVELSRQTIYWLVIPYRQRIK